MESRRAADLENDIKRKGCLPRPIFTDQQSSAAAVSANITGYRFAGDALQP
jgi:hypothetical protein